MTKIKTQETFEEEIVSKKLAVCRVLRDHPSLRRKENRSLVWKLAQQDRPDLTQVDNDRLCRHIQNTRQLYQPEEQDGRFNKELEYREFFGQNR